MLLLLPSSFISPVIILSKDRTQKFILFAQSAVSAVGPKQTE